MHTRQSLTGDLRRLGLQPGDTIMVHASLKAVGPVAGGPASVVDALLDAVGPEGTLLAYVSWDRSPYEETLGGCRLSEEERIAWPAFDPRTAGTERSFGVLNQFIAGHPRAARSGQPDASMAAIGRDAEWLVADHPFDSSYGPGSPLDKFVQQNGRVLMLGAPLDAVTLLHYAESIADIPGKRRVSLEMPILDPEGRKIWARVEEFDTNGILDCYAPPAEMDAVESIARDYVTERPHRTGAVGSADCRLFEGPDLVAFGKQWLETRHGRPG